MSNLERAEADFVKGSNILPDSYKTADLPSCISRHFAPEGVLGILETLKNYLKEV